MPGKGVALLLSSTLVLSLFLGTLAVISANPAQAQSLGSWTSTTSYPIAAQPRCVADSGYIYCVGGLTSGGGFSSAAYFAKFSNPGIGTWQQTTSYPTPVTGNSCVAYSGYIYCVGGLSNSTYFASLGPNGIGAWSPTTSYPHPVNGLSCVAYAGYIYCMTGFYQYPPPNVYFSPISSTGIGPWSASGTYPQTVYDALSCAADGAFAYCVAGNANAGPSGYIGQTVASSPLSSAGAGAWSLGPSYPFPSDGPACSASAGYIYCLGGETGSTGNGSVCYQTNGGTSSTCHSADLFYYSQLASGSMGSWQQGPTYPTPVESTSCVVFGSYNYCIGGIDYNGTTAPELSSVYYIALIGGTPSTSTTSSLSTSSTSSKTTTTATSSLLSTSSIATTNSFSTTTSRTATSVSTTTQTTQTPCQPVACSLNLTASGGQVQLSLSGNVSASQFSGLAFSENAAQDTYTLSFAISGTGGTHGRFTLTIPKTLVPNGFAPQVLIDGQPASGASSSQDSASYHVTVDIHFSTHDIEMIFASKSISTTGTTQGGIPEFPFQLVGLVFVTLLIVGSYLVMRHRAPMDGSAPKLRCL